MNELALFAGGGGGILAGHLLGWRTVCAVEIEDYPRRVLLQRQADGFLPRFPIWDDICTFDGKPWRGKIDVVSGGFPCQDLSVANQKGDGLDGERSGMWREMARIISEVRPRFAFVENSPMLLNRGLDRVLGDFSKMGFDAKWGIMGADAVGAPHRRERIWIFAYPHGFRPIQRKHKGNRVSQQEDYSDKSNNGNRVWGEADRLLSLDKWSEFTSKLCGMDDGLASRVDRLKAIGNGQVPLCAATAWRILSESL